MATVSPSVCSEKRTALGSAEELCPQQSPRSPCPPEMVLLADADPLPPSAGSELLGRVRRLGHPLAGALNGA